MRVALSKFRQLGAVVEGEAARAAFGELDARCAALAFEIEHNINEDAMEVPILEADLAGCAPDFIDALPLQPGERAADPPVRLCSVKAPVQVPIMKRASCEARRRMLLASQRRCAAVNGPLLGFSSHAARPLSSPTSPNHSTAPGMPPRDAVVLPPPASPIPPVSALLHRSPSRHPPSPHRRVLSTEVVS